MTSTSSATLPVLPSSSSPPSSVTPPTHQDLVLQLDEESMWRIVVGVGEYFRNIEASQSQQVSSSSTTTTSSNVGERGDLYQLYSLVARALLILGTCVSGAW